MKPYCLLTTYEHPVFHGHEPDLRGKLREAELKLYRAEAEITRLKHDLGRRDDVIKSLKTKQHESTFTYESALRGEKRKSSSASMDVDNWRRKLQESENKYLDARKERNEAVARLEKEVLAKSQALDEKCDELGEVSKFEVSLTVLIFAITAARPLA